MHLDRHETLLARQKPTSSLTAQEHLMRGRYGLREGYNISAAISELEKAIEFDPGYAEAHALLAWAYAIGMFNIGLSCELAITRALNHCALALAANPSDPKVLADISVSEILIGEHERAERHSRLALERNPSDVHAISARALVTTYCGMFDEAKACFETAKILDPLDDQAFGEMYTDFLFLTGQHEEMLRQYHAWPNIPIHLRLTEAAANAVLGRHTEAAAALRMYSDAKGPKPDPLTFIRLELNMCAKEPERERVRLSYRAAGFDV